MLSSKGRTRLFLRHKPRARVCARFGLTLCALSLCVPPAMAGAQATAAQATGAARANGSPTLSASQPPAIVPPGLPAPSEGGLLAQMSRELSALAMQSRDAVVSIQGRRALSAQEMQAGRPGGEPGNRFASLPPNAPAFDRPIYVPVFGSGFLIQGDLVVTTSEVAENIVNPVVVLADGRSLRVLAKNLDKDNNLAVFRVARPLGVTALRFLRLGDSDDILPCSLAVTIGNQAGFAGSSGLAVVAKTGRRARSGARFYPNLIQFQGAVGPGSSGSPLINPLGEVVGMVIATPDMSPTGYRGGGENDGLAGGRSRERRPVEEEHADKTARNTSAKTHKEQHSGDTSDNQGANRPGEQNGDGRGKFASGSMPRPGGPGSGPFGGLSSMGFALPVNAFRGRLDALAQNMQAVAAPGWVGLHAENGPLPGAYITNLYDGSPADKSGLDVGDIITQVEGRPIRSRWDFFMALAPLVEGQTLRVQVQRGGATRALLIHLSATPDQDAMRRMSQRVPARVGMRLLLCLPTA